MRAILAGGGRVARDSALAIANQLKKSYGLSAVHWNGAGDSRTPGPAAGFRLRASGGAEEVSLVQGEDGVRFARGSLGCGAHVGTISRLCRDWVGGYASARRCCGVVKHIPTWLFEPNAVPGFANRMVARFVSAAAVHFEQRRNIFVMRK